MSDLSRLLGDVYGASTPPAEDAETADPTSPMAVPAAADDPPAPPVEGAGTAAPGPTAPGWADDAVLDEAFAEWVPGPPADADAEERDMLAGVEPAEAVADEIDIDSWLGPEPVDDDVVDPEPTAATEAFAGFDGYDFVPPADPAEEARAAAEAEAEANWTRDSDDLLPRGRRNRRLSLTLRR